MKKIVSLIMLVAFIALVGCSANIHKIGKGAQGGDVISARQWYILFGLMPLNEVDTNQMAGDATNYEIKTEQGVMDIIINSFTSAVTVYSRTVTVTK
jgi:Bor protein